MGNDHETSHIDIFQQQKIAVIHEWLSNYAGSETVTEKIISFCKNVSVYATVDFMDTDKKEIMLNGLKPHTTFIQNLPFAKEHFRYYLPLFPFAIKRHKLDQYDILLSSSHAFAHGINKNHGQIHICYCHTPMRYIWDMQDLYLKANNMDKGIAAFCSKILAKLLRKWDFKISQNVDYYISNSNFTADRIKRNYGRPAKVIYPPVNIDRFIVEKDKEDFYVTASRLVCYKKTDLVVEAFCNMPDKKLIVIGDGKLKSKILEMATPNITVLSHLSFDEFHRYLRKAKGFVFAGEEDFGITVVEAQACGTPVIGYNKGGTSEIIIDKITGVLFDNQTSNDIVNAVNKFEQTIDNFDSYEIRKNSERFSTEVFKYEYEKFVTDCINKRV